MADAEKTGSKSNYSHDTSHLSPSNFDLSLYMWRRPSLAVGRGYTLDFHWGSDPPDVRHVRFRASGALSRHSRVFDVHLVISLEEQKVSIQTWSSMGMLAKAIQMVLERDHDFVVKPIDRTVIDVDYVDTKNYREGPDARHR
jgi:hypothetical protein